MRHRTQCPPHDSGLTLIELMVALAIFAVLGVMSYRALSVAANGEARLDSDVQRQEALSRALGRIESEILAIVEPTAPGVGALQFDANEELSFLRLDEGRGVRRVGFRLSGQKLEWLLWEGRERTGLPQVEVLLDGVERLRWQFYDQGRRLSVWPPEAAYQAKLPAGIGVELDVSGQGTFNRLFALR